MISLFINKTLISNYFKTKAIRTLESQILRFTTKDLTIRKIKSITKS